MAAPVCDKLSIKQGGTPEANSRLEVHTMQATRVTDIRNDDGRLVGRYHPETNTLEIKTKDCVTNIRFLPNGKLEVINSKTA